MDCVINKKNVAVAKLWNKHIQNTIRLVFWMVTTVEEVMHK